MKKIAHSDAAFAKNGVADKMKLAAKGHDPGEVIFAALAIAVAYSNAYDMDGQSVLDAFADLLECAVDETVDEGLIVIKRNTVRS